MTESTPRRHPIPKRLRWQVLERDNHTCQYCGTTPADGALHVDHIIPVADGGKTEADNLITACEPCNTGKGAGTPAIHTLPDMAQAADDLKQRVEAIRQWRNTYAQYEGEVLAAADEIHGQYGLSIPHHVIAAVIREYGIDEAVYAAKTVCGRIAYNDPQGQNAYFHGVLRRRRENGTQTSTPTVTIGGCPFGYGKCWSDSGLSGERDGCCVTKEDGTQTACSPLVDSCADDWALIGRISEFVAVWRERRLIETLREVL